MLADAKPDQLSICRIERGNLRTLSNGIMKNESQ